MLRNISKTTTIGNSYKNVNFAYFLSTNNNVNAQSKSGEKIDVRENTTLKEFLEDGLKDNTLHKDSFRVVKQDYRFTLSELNGYTDALAVGYNYGRFLPGNRVVHSLENTGESLITHLASAKNGSIISPIPSIHSKEDLDDALKRTSAKGYIFPPKIQKRKVKQDNIKRLFELCPKMEQRVENQEPWKDRNYPNLKHCVHDALEHIVPFSSMQDCLVYNPLPSPLIKINRDYIKPDTCHMIKKMSNNKYECFSNSNFVSGAIQVSKILELDEKERILYTGDVSDVATYTSMLSSFVNNNLMIIANPFFRVKDSTNALVDEYCTTLVTTYDHLDQINDFLQKTNLAKFSEHIDLLKKIYIIDPLDDNAYDDATKQSIIKNAYQHMPNVTNIITGIYTENATAPIGYIKTDNINNNDDFIVSPNTTISIGKQFTVSGPQISNSSWNEDSGYIQSSKSQSISSERLSNLLK
eukprot:TRINITY_DN6184_c0_g1_i1.p1 TRINITY_DN6184_c0_g1~~TRINITY_DN6184_c0_g1_i1.p1  ORF type:complete len:468 (-),score=123.66 TRINITY_DN6184_c0_g1_i1:167-1570(-)